MMRQPTCILGTLLYSGLATLVVLPSVVTIAEKVANVARALHRAKRIRLLTYPITQSLFCSLTVSFDSAERGKLDDFAFGVPLHRF